MLSLMWALLPNRATAASCPPSTIRYLPSCLRRLRYRHFARAGEATRYAIKKLPFKVLSGKSLEVNDKRYNTTQIHAL